MKRLLCIILFLALAGVACGEAAQAPTQIGTTPTTQAATAPAEQATAQPTQAPTPTGGPYKVGDTVGTADGFAITVNKVSTSQGADYETPPQGDQYLVLDVSVKNISGQVQQVNPLDFTLIDSTGQHMTWTIVSGLPGVTSYDMTALQPGATDRGSLVYEVPLGKASYQLSFAINQFSGTQTLWNIHS